MNIGFSKNGKSIKFREKNFSPTGGDIDAGNMLRILANNNPDHKFYLLGRSEFSKLSETEKFELFDHDNIIDAYAKLVGPIEDQLFRAIDDLGIKIDCHVMMPGQMGTVSIPNKILQMSGNGLTTSVIEMTLNYGTPINKWQNEHQEIPLIELCTDPRYTVAQSRDFLKTPEISLSQYNDSYIRRFIKSYADQELVFKEVNRIYSGIERLFLYRRPLENINPDKRTDLFTIVLNEGKPSRYKLLDSWVLSKFSDVDVYGEWDEKWTKNDERFCGPLKLEDLHERLSVVRCSFIIPIAPGWVTAKYIELIHAGVIPFFHPTYDEQNHLDVPEFLRPKTKDELYKRIEMMRNDDMYLRVIQSLRQQFCTEDQFSGETINNTVMQYVIGKNYTRSDVKQKTREMSSLDGFF